MNAELLLKHFDRLCDAPDAVPRLRQFVLDLAVRGKLVEQDPSDEPASELLDRILVDRAKLERKKILRNAKQPDFPPESESHLISIPDSWTWASSDQCAALEPNAIADGPFGANLKTAHYISNPGFRVIRLQNIGSTFFKDHEKTFISEERFDSLAKHHVFPGDLVVAGLVAPDIRCCLIPSGVGPALVKADCYRFAANPNLSNRYLLFYINSPTCKAITSGHHHGMTLTRIGLGNFRSLPIPLPPLNEQHRIVAKVGELMALCDELEAAQTKREHRRDRLNKASLNRLSDPEPSDDDGDGTSELRDHASFHLRHLDRLVVRPEQVQELRQTILDLAVRGRLVPQDPADEPASELLTHLRGLKDQLEAAELPGKRKTLDCGPPTVSFGIPESWQLALFDELFVIVSGVAKGRKIRGGQRQNVPYLRVANVQRGFLDLSLLKSLEASSQEVERYRLKDRDILMTEGGDWDKLGRAAIWAEQISTCIHQNHVFRVRTPNPELLRPKWTTTYSNSPLGRAFFEDASKQTTNLASINMTQLRSCPLPIPPANEQKRIVAKVDELMALCDELEAQLEASQTRSRRLLESLLQEALSSAA